MLELAFLGAIIIRENMGQTMVSLLVDVLPMGLDLDLYHYGVAVASCVNDCIHTSTTRYLLLQLVIHVSLTSLLLRELLKK